MTDETYNKNEWWEQIKQDRAKRMERKRQKDIERDHYADMLLPEITRNLMKNCDIDEKMGLRDIEAQLLNQAATLNAAFITSMHEAGLGHGGTLTPEALRAAQYTQRLARQTYSTLLKAQKHKSDKETKEP